MSRTYRRRNTKVPDWALSNIKYDGNICVWVKATGKELERLKALYYSDKGCGHHCMSNAPAWFRRYRNRFYRNRMKQECNRILRKMDLWTYNFDVPKKDAGWLWW